MDTVMNESEDVTSAARRFRLLDAIKKTLLEFANDISSRVDYVKALTEDSDWNAVVKEFNFDSLDGVEFQFALEDELDRILPDIQIGVDWNNLTLGGVVTRLERMTK